MDLEEKEPFVRIRDIYDEGEPNGFSLFDWTFSEYSSERLMWVDISPIRKVRRGRLVKDEIVDNSEYVLAALLSTKTPYSMSGINYRVWGYYEAGRTPEFL